MKFKIIFLIALFLIPLVFAIPENLNINGKLTDNFGNILSGTYLMNFSIYNVSSGGTALWNSTQSVTTDSNGIFSAVLSNVNLNFSENYYLGIAMGSDNEMSPRINLTSSGYAFRAKNISVGGIEFDTDVDAGSKNITTTGNVTASWFRGIFNWLIGSSSSNYLSFNGTQLDFNETYANLTYVRLNANNSIGNYNFSINGSTFFVDANNQRVGIGTTTPLAILSVFGSGTSTGFFTNTAASSSSAGAGMIGYSDDGAALASGDRLGFYLLGGANDASHTLKNVAGFSSFATEAWSGTANGADLRFEVTLNNATSRSEAMRILNSGNVGIGTTSPGAKLHVNGTGNLLNISNQTNSHLFVNGSTGFVGIGTTSPKNNLNVVGDGNFTGLLYVSGSLLNVTEPLWTANFSNVVFNNQNNSIGNYNFSINGSTFFVDAKNQRVGIGTTSPGVKLEVSDNGVLRVTGGTTPSYPTTGAGIEYGYDSDDTSQGTTGRGFMIAYDRDASAFKSFRYNTYDLAFQIQSNTKMFIDNAGNVGIGTTSPGSKLHVNGTDATLNISNQTNSHLFVNGSTGFVGIGTTSPKK